MKKKKRNKQYNGRPNTTQKTDTKGVIRSRNSKDRQYNEKKKRNKQYNGRPNTTQKTKDGAIPT
jgi:hypothetical protein